jgi:thiol-disulfide isomerase/thioredoxin
MTGKAVTLQDFRGKIIYVDFWFSQCRPCLAEAPATEQLKKRFIGKDVVFLYISTDVVLADWRKTIATHSLSGPNSVHLLDPQGVHAVQAYQVQGFPTYMIISRDGHILQRDAPRPSAGKATEKALEQALQAKS